MNTKDRFNGDIKKKRKIQNVTTKIIPGATNYTSSQPLYNNKVDYDKLDKVQKSARSTKLDSNSKSTLKHERSFRTLTAVNQTKSIIQEPLSNKQYVSNAQRNTRDNEKILADNDMHYDNNDLVRPNKRWSDLPKPSQHFNLLSNPTPLTNFAGIRSRNDITQVFEPESYQIQEKPKGHIRTYSTSKVHIASQENNSQLSTAKGYTTRNVTKISKQNNIPSLEQNSQFHLINNEYNNENSYLSGLSKKISNVIVKIKFIIIIFSKKEKI